MSLRGWHRREGESRLEQDVRVAAAFGEVRAFLPTGSKQSYETADFRARLLIVGDGVLGETIREAFHTTEFDVVA